MLPQQISETPQHPWPAFLSGDPPLGLGALGPRDSTPIERAFPILDCPYVHAKASSALVRNLLPIQLHPHLCAFLWQNFLKKLLFCLSLEIFHQVLAPTTPVSHTCQPLISMSPNPMVDLLSSATSFLQIAAS